MDNKSKVCHDLKTERSDVAQPLPAVASALPIAFYLAVIGAIGLNIFFFMKTKDADEEAAQFKQAEAAEIQLRGKTVAEGEALKKEERRANDVVTWINGSRSFQPLIVAIAKNMQTKGSIVELGLSREPANPNQIRLNLKFEGLTSASSQIESIEGALLAMGYRTYNAQQTRGQGGKKSHAYQATLLWNEGYIENLTANNNQNDE